MSNGNIPLLLSRAQAKRAVRGKLFGRYDSTALNGKLVQSEVEEIDTEGGKETFAAVATKVR